MSKSLDNYIGLTDSAKDMFGKTMSIPDTMIARYLEYACFASASEVESLSKGLADGSLHPRTAKVDIAKRIVELYHGAEAGDEALAEFERVFVKKDIPDVIEERTMQYQQTDIVTLLVDTAMAASKSEARRLVTQGGVSIDAVKITDPYASVDITEQRILRVGKLRFLRIIGQ
jgi:tyrosyl-tRNA synthetase